MHHPISYTYLGKVKKFQAVIRALLRFIAKKPRGGAYMPPRGTPVQIGLTMNNKSLDLFENSCSICKASMKSNGTKNFLCAEDFHANIVLLHKLTKVII